MLFLRLLFFGLTVVLFKFFHSVVSTFIVCQFNCGSIQVFHSAIKNAAVFVFF